MANKVKYGLRNVYYAKATINGSTITYATPVKIEGAVTLSLDAQGDETTFYADDTAYFTTFANNGYSGSIEIADMPKSFRKDILGEIEDSNGALFESADAVPATFALGFEVQGDEQPRRAWYYNCNVSRPSENEKTKEASITPSTDTLNIKATPRVSDKKVRGVMVKSSTNETAYNGFFTAVYEQVSSI